MSWIGQSVSSIQQALRDRQVSVTELVNESYSRIAATDEGVKAFLTLAQEQAKSTAAALDQRLSAEGSAVIDTNPLFGVPMGIKDNILTKGVRTTCASKFLENHTAVYDATVMNRLKTAGAVMVGKLNMDEFAMGSSNENSAFFSTHNPWDLSRVPGGSSGASAASVAADQVVFSLGSDTGGSIRQPASYCGVVGVKPTYGRVSRYGLVAFASSLDQIGPLTRSVEDSAIVLEAICGHDPLDSTSAQLPTESFRQALTGDVKGLRIGYVAEWLGHGVQPGVREAIQAALREFEAAGAIVEEVHLPHSEYVLGTYYLLASSEASSNLARFDGVRYGVRAEAKSLIDLYVRSRSEGFGAEVKRRIMLGTYALSSGYYDAYYLKAQKVRTLIKQDFDQLFETYDLIVGPTAPTTAFPLGAHFEDPKTMYLNDICTIPVNLAGLPAISLPCGLSDGMPVGLQMIAKPFAEQTMLRAAHAFEQRTAHHQARPAMAGKGGVSR